MYAVAVGIAIFFPARAQQQEPRIEFEAAAIHPSGDCIGGGQPQPGRLSLKCVTVNALIQMAYGYFANGVSYTPTILQVRGAPAWASSDRYDLTATAKGDPSQAVMRGPMLQALLEERFHLQFHQATEQGPVYFLTTIKSGIRMQRLPANGCTPADTEACGTETRKKTGRTLTVTVHGSTMSALANGLLSQLADRPVIDKTGLTGLFNIQLQYAPDQEVSTDDATEFPSLFTALQEQLGLKLTAGTGPVPVFVIDRLERPSAN
jgi:uncharacterized protein (TIGR03435 family)